MSVGLRVMKRQLGFAGWDHAGVYSPRAEGRGYWMRGQCARFLFAADSDHRRHGSAESPHFTDRQPARVRLVITKRNA